MAQDHGLAIASFMNAADVGHSGAMYAVGVMYLRGLGVVANPTTAADYLAKAQAAGFAQAGALLKALAAGEDTGKFPVLPVPKPSGASNSADRSQGNRPSESGSGAGRPGSTKWVIAAVVALLVVGGGGYGFYAYRQSVAKEAERQERMAAEQKEKAVKAEEETRQQEAKRKEEAALAEQKTKLDAQEAELKAKAEALRQQEQQRADSSQAAAASAPTAQGAPATAELSKRIASLMSAYALDRARPMVAEMLDASKASDEARINAAAEQLRALSGPARGDRQVARAANLLGLKAFQSQSYGEASKLFCDALAADPADQEIVNNLAYSLEKWNHLAEARNAAIAAITLAPRRSSAWANLGTILAAEGKEETGVAALLLAYRFSQNQQKTIEYLEKTLTENPPPAVAAAVTRTLKLLRK